MIEVLYEDNHIIAVNKKSGDLVQGDKTGDKPLSESVKDYLRDKYGLTWFDQPADAWRKLSPKIAAKIDELEERINKLEK